MTGENRWRTSFNSNREAQVPQFDAPDAGTEWDGESKSPKALVVEVRWLELRLAVAGSKSCCRDRTWKRIVRRRDLGEMLGTWWDAGTGCQNKRRPEEA